MCPHTILLEPISECMMAGGLAAWAAYVIFRSDVTECPIILARSAVSIF